MALIKVSVTIRFYSEYHPYVSIYRHFSVSEHLVQCLLPLMYQHAISKQASYMWYD